MRISDWSSDVCSSDLPSGGEKASENGPLRWGTRRMEPLMLNASKTLLPDILAAHGRWVASGGKEGERADFSDAMLEEVDLAAAELDIPRFRRANQRPPNFSGPPPKGPAPQERPEGRTGGK